MEPSDSAENEKKDKASASSDIQWRLEVGATSFHSTPPSNKPVPNAAPINSLHVHCAHCGNEIFLKLGAFKLRVAGILQFHCLRCNSIVTGLFGPRWK